jgi:hypothetical protein
MLGYYVPCYEQHEVGYRVLEVGLFEAGSQ